MIVRVKKMESTGETLIVPPVPIPFYCGEAQPGDVLCRCKFPVSGELKYVSFTVDKAVRQSGDEKILVRFENAGGTGISLGLELNEGDTVVREVIPVEARACYLLRNTGCTVQGIWITMMFEVR